MAQELDGQRYFIFYAKFAWFALCLFQTSISHQQNAHDWQKKKEGISVDLSAPYSLLKPALLQIWHEILQENVELVKIMLYILNRIEEKEVFKV